MREGRIRDAKDKKEETSFATSFGFNIAFEVFVYNVSMNGRNSEGKNNITNKLPLHYSSLVFSSGKDFRLLYSLVCEL